MKSEILMHVDPNVKVLATTASMKHLTVGLTVVDACNVEEDAWKGEDIFYIPLVQFGAHHDKPDR